MKDGGMNDNKKNKPKQSNTEWYFFGAVALTYVIVAIVKGNLALKSLSTAGGIFLNILPAFGIIFAAMWLVNYFVDKKTVKKILGVRSGPKRWLIAVISGVLSTGPIYAWYPLLNDLRKKGLDYGFIATFLYNRAVKLPLLPLFIYYFSPTFTGVLLGVMVIVSILQGLLFVQLENAGLV